MKFSLNEFILGQFNKLLGKTEKISKKEIISFISKSIELKIKKELNIFKKKLISYILFGIGFLFLVYGLIGTLVYYFNLPLFFQNIFFALILFILGLFYLVFN